MAVSGISPYAIGGLASGLDTNSIVDKLIEVQRKQGDHLYTKKTSLQRQKEVLRNFNLQLLRLQNAAFDLRIGSNFSTRTAVSSNESVLKATASSSAAPGRHTVKVERMAEQARASSHILSPRVLAYPPNTAGITGISGAQVPTPTYWYGAAAEDPVNEGKIAASINSTNNRLTVSFGSTTVTVTLNNASAGVTSMDTVAADIQDKVNSALNQARGTSGVTYLVVNAGSASGAGNDCFRFISNFNGSQYSFSIDTASGAASALGLSDPSSITVQEGSDPVGGQYVLTFTAPTASYITGTSASGPFTIETGVNDLLNITVNGVNREITLSPQSAVDGSTMAAALQEDINSAFGSGTVSVSYNGSAFVITNGKAGSANTIVLSAASVPGQDARAALGLDTVSAAAGTNARVVSVFTPVQGAVTTAILEDTTEAGTASDMENLLRRINGDSLLSGHTESGGTGPLITGVTLAASSGLSAGTATILTTRGNELNSQLATYATFVGTSGAATTALDLSQTLDNAGFATAPTSATNGTFTINGKTITISDYQTTTVYDVIAMINSSGAGVTASYDPAGNRMILTANQKGSGQTITVGSNTDTSNFLYISGLIDGTFNAGYDDGSLDPTVPLSSSGISKSVTAGTFSINGVSIYIDPAIDSLNSVIEKINNSGAGVVASYNSVTDTLTLIGKEGEYGKDFITIGGTTDTSNFWWAMNMAYPPLIEGSDDVLNVPVAIGGPAQGAVVAVDGEVYTRRTNRIDNIIPGVTLELKSASSTPVTLEIGNDIDQALNKVKKFIAEYNKTVEMASPEALTKEERENQLPELTDEQRKLMSDDEIEAYEARREALLQREILRKDSVVRGYYITLRQLASTVIPGLESGYNSLAALGIDTGPIGSSAGSNPHGMLLLESTDEAEIEEALRSNNAFMTALQEQPDKVALLFSQLTGSTVKQTGDKSLPTVVLAQQLEFSIGDGSNRATVAIAPGTYTGANIVNLINNRITAAGISTIQATLNSANQLVLTAAVSSDNQNGQAYMDITDLSGGQLYSLLGIQPGLYRGTSVKTLTGIGRRIENETKALTGTGGLLNSRIRSGGSLDKQIDTVDKAIDAFEKRMTRLETRLWKQFTTLETYISNMNSLSTWLTQQITNLTGTGNSSS